MTNENSSKQEWGINFFFNTKSNYNSWRQLVHTQTDRQTHTESRIIQTKSLESFTRFFSLLVWAV